MKNIIKLTLPFSILGMAFILLGLVLNDAWQIEFGIVWIILAIAAIIIRNLKQKRNDKV